MNARWRKIGKAYRLADQFSIIWATKAGSNSWRLAYRRGDGGWSTLGVHATLRDAQVDGLALFRDGGSCST
jgi:hypothetical protein